MKKSLSCIVLCATLLFLCSCSVTCVLETSTSTSSTTDTFPPIEYNTAFNFVKECEQRIIDANSSVGPNKLGQNAAEFIIFSDDYAGLYCAYWAALEVIGKQDDSRFSKSKLRWQMDFTNEEWKNLLVSAFDENGFTGFTSEYGRIYDEIVSPAVESLWKKKFENSTLP